MGIKRSFLAATALASVLALAACSGGSSDDGVTTQAPETGGTETTQAPETGGTETTASPLESLEPVSLTLGMAAPSAGQPCVFWANSEGVMDALKLDLTISPQGANEPAMAAAGQLVIGANTITQSFPALQAGRHVVSVLAQTQGNPSDAVTVKADSDYNELQDLSGQKVGVVGNTGYNMVAATLYSNHIVENGGEPLQIIVQPDVNTLTAQLVNGQIAAAVFPPVFGPQISAGILREIVSPKDPLPMELNGKGILNSSLWGLSSEIEKNKDAVTRLVAACRIADAQMEDKTAAEIAESLAKNPEFAPAVKSLEDLTTEIEKSWIGFQPDNQGYITKEGWDTTLGTFVKVGIKANDKAFAIDDPNLQYENGVDMSYWDAATPLVEAYLANNS